MKNLIYIFEYLIIIFLFRIFKLIGYKNSSNLGKILGKYIGPYFRSKVQIANNLNKANIKFKKENDIIASEVLETMDVYLQNILLEDFRNNKLENHIEIEGSEHFMKL